MRLFVAMRSRLAEDSARAAIEKGVRQILVMGAGLDTFAYRLEPAQDMRVFELDHPATQAEKRRRLADARIAEPPHVTYVAHDFERGSMIGALKAGGFDPGNRTFVLWLGVTPYLTEEAVFATLRRARPLTGRDGSRVRLYQPADAVAEATTRNFHREMAERVAASGEPFRGYFDSGELHARARQLGIAKSRISIERRSSPAICRTRRSRPGPGRADTSSGWRRRRANCIGSNRDRHCEP